MNLNKLSCTTIVAACIRRQTAWKGQAWGKDYESTTKSGSTWPSSILLFLSGTEVRFIHEEANQLITKGEAIEARVRRRKGQEKKGFQT